MEILFYILIGVLVGATLFVVFIMIVMILIRIQEGHPAETFVRNLNDLSDKQNKA